MTEWQGIAIAGIWLGTGLSAFAAKEGVIGVALFAFLATMFVAAAK